MKTILQKGLLFWTLACFLAGLAGVPLSSCRSKVTSKAVGVPDAGINVHVIKPGEGAQIGVETGAVTIEPGTFNEAVSVEVKKVENPDDVSTVTEKAKGPLVSDPIEVTTKTLDGEFVDPSTVKKEIIITFTISGDVDRKRLVGIIITKPDGRVIEIANNDLVIKDRDDGRIDVSFRTKEVNAIFALALGEEVLAQQEADILIPGSKSEVRRYFQTRSLITFQLDLNTASGADSFSVENETTGLSLVQGQTLMLGLFEGFRLLPSHFSEKDLMLTFYPFDPDVRRAFSYGENDIMIHVNRPDYPVFSQTKVWVKDFDMFEPSFMGFRSSKRQVSSTANGNRFEGWLNVTKGKKMVSKDGSIIVTGMQAIIDQ